MLTQLEVPLEWQGILKELQIHQPKAILAGGCLRDLYMGVPPKDLDFFMPVPLTLPSWCVDNGTAFDYEGMEFVLAVLSVKREPLPINLIYIEDVPIEKLLDSFDMGFCQIGYDGTNVVKTPAFEWDVKHGIITLWKMDRYRRSLQRWARINQRYNMELSIPLIDEILRNPAKKEINAEPLPTPIN